MGSCALPHAAADGARGDATPKSEVRLHRYTAYGLGIHSELPLPELVVASQAKRDLIIRLGQVAHRLWGADRTTAHYYVAAEEAYLHCQSVGTFLARSGREIVVEPAPAVDEQDVRIALEGLVLGAVAHQRGMLALHASAVVIDGEAVAFVGAKGQGKSTMAAALYARGHALLADDLVVLNNCAAERVTVLPGFPQLNLWPDAAVASLGDDPETLPRLSRGYEKRARCTADRFPRQSMPLRCLYMLETGASLALAALSPREALFSVIGQSYVARTFPYSLWGVKASAHFVRCAALIHSVPAYRLQRSTSLALLPASVQMVEEHLAAQAQEAPSRLKDLVAY